ncbi:hypothetical protein [Streptomyces anandii]|uniref:Phage holin family protein n=1 Tax=Streptomyces anandii TaxID=285454 RepID=A0ABW6H212_9ACTN
MVFRSTWQDLRQWVRSCVLGGEEPSDSGAFGLSDEELKAQAIQDKGQTDNLIAIEKERGATRMKQMAVLGAIALVALVFLLLWALVVIYLARGLKLPWPLIRTVGLSVLGTSGVSGLAWGGKRLWNRRKGATATAANPSENRAEGEPDQVGTA